MDNTLQPPVQTLDGPVHLVHIVHTMKSLFLASLLILSNTRSLSAADYPEWSAKVSVTVQCKDPVRTSTLNSYITRELRSLKNVVVTDISPRYEVAVLALESGRMTALSIIVTERTTFETWTNLVTASGLEGGHPEYIAQSATNLVDLKGHWIFTTSPDELKKAGEDIVAAIDSSVLESDRKSHQNMAELFKKLRQPKVVKKADDGIDFTPAPPAGFVVDPPVTHPASPPK